MTEIGLGRARPLRLRRFEPESLRPDHLDFTGPVKFAAAVKSAAVKSAAATDFTGPSRWSGLSSAGFLAFRSGVRRVIVGHKPCGDCPAVCSARYSGVEVVCAGAFVALYGALMMRRARHLLATSPQ
jgi:hypothetical protein